MPHHTVTTGTTGTTGTTTDTTGTTAVAGTPGTTGTPRVRAPREPRPARVDLHDVVAAGTATALAAWLAATRAPRTRADQLADLSDAEVRAVVRLLDPGTARTLLRSLGLLDVRDLLRAVPTATVGGLVAVLDARTAADLLRLLDDDGERVAVRIAVQRSRSAAAHGLLAWPAGSAASRMQPVDADRPSPGVTPAAATPAPVRAEADLAEAVALLAEPGTTALAVLDGDRRIGTLTAADVADLVEAPAAPPTARRTPLATRLRDLLRRP